MQWQKTFRTPIFSTVFIVWPLFCALMSCREPVKNVDLLPMRVMDCSIYTTDIQEGFQAPHVAVFAIVHCEVHGGYRSFSDYKTEYPLQTPTETFAGQPIYTEGTLINVKMTEHRPTDLEGIAIKDVAEFHREVVFIGFCREGDYRLNVNGFEKTFRVGNRMPNAIGND